MCNEKVRHAVDSDEPMRDEDPGIERSADEAYAAEREHRYAAKAREFVGRYGVGPDAIRAAISAHDYDLDHVFAYHRPTEADTVRYNLIRTAARAFAQVVLETTPACADQQAAIRHIREAVMTANASIALGGRVSRR